MTMTWCVGYVTESVKGNDNPLIRLKLYQKNTFYNTHRIVLRSDSVVLRLLIHQNVTCEASQANPYYGQKSLGYKNYDNHNDTLCAQTSVQNFQIITTLKRESHVKDEKNNYCIKKMRDRFIDLIRSILRPIESILCLPAETRLDSQSLTCRDYL